MSKPLVVVESPTKVRTIKKYLGKDPDFILINNTQITADILNSYKKYNEEEAINDLKDHNGYKVIKGDLIDNKQVETNSSDVLYRSILRHDSKKVAEVLNKIFNA